MLKINATLEHKPSDFRLSTCAVDKVVTITQTEFEDFVRAPLRDRDFIEDNIELMYCDENYLCHCMLVLGESTLDGIIVESEGYGYARKAAYLPNISTYINSQILQLADGIIKTGTQNTPNGRCVVNFDELQKRFDVTVSPDNGIGQMLASALNMSDEVAEIEMTEDGFDVTYYLDYCSNLDKEHRLSPVSTTKLSDILRCNFENVHLCHSEVENEPITICELNSSTLTTDGKKEWADVLGAEVHRVYTGIYGLQVELSSVKAARIYDFGAALAGYCSQKNYEKWFTQENVEPIQTMKME